MRGHIRQRGKRKDRWTVVVEMDRTPDNKRHQQWVTVRGTRKDAERRLAELLVEVETGAYVKPTKETLAQFLRRWLDDCVRYNVRPVTEQEYRRKVERSIIPELGEIPIVNLQQPHLEAFYRRALESGRADGKGGLSARTVLQLHRILYDALNHAVKWGVVTRNVAQAVEPPRAHQKDMHTLDSDGVARLLEASKDTPYYQIFHLAVYTGMRRSELLGLRWRDVDLDMATLSVVQAMHHLRDGRVVFEQPKSHKGRRQVALSPAAVLALREHRERQNLEAIMAGRALTSDDLVFSTADGSPLLPNSLTHAFVKTVRRAGLPAIRLHDLRHTHASLMLRQGVHPKIVSERLGHATVGITLDIYSHVTPGLQEAAALSFEQSLQARGSVDTPSPATT